MTGSVVPYADRSKAGSYAQRLAQPISKGSTELLNDLLTRLDFEIEVLHYERRPVSIPYTDANGDPGVYTPALLITYGEEGEPGRRLLLCDVMLRADLFENWKKLKPMLKAGRSFARERGWSFKILTERNVSTPFLWNARFLLPYRRLPRHPVYTGLLLNKLAELRATNAEALIAACSEDEGERKAMLPFLWQLVADKRIGADLICPVTMSSALWSLD